MAAVDVVSGDFELTMAELRLVAAYVTEHAESVQHVFVAAHPDDLRPRAAIAAARQFVAGARRTRLQRVTSLDAHRAATAASTEPARLAARAAGDAASAAYLHPITRAHQVGHILRAAACVARISELDRGGVAAAADSLAASRARAVPGLVDVLHRYPPAPPGRNRVDELMCTLDSALRTSR